MFKSLAVLDITGCEGYKLTITEMLVKGIR